MFTNGALKAICLPTLHAGEANVVKSPASIAAVGVIALKAAGIWCVTVL